MRKLGSAQLAVLRFINTRYSLVGGVKTPSGLTKSATLSSDWRVMDRLAAIGLLEERFVIGEGTTFFVTEAGQKALAVTRPKSEGGL